MLHAACLPAHWHSVGCFLAPRLKNLFIDLAMEKPLPPLSTVTLTAYTLGKLARCYPRS
jgi:hypothetical protein